MATLPANSPEASAEAGLITSLQSEQNDATSELIDIQSQISEAKLNTDVNSSGIKVLEQRVVGLELRGEGRGRSISPAASSSV